MKLLQDILSLSGADIEHLQSRAVREGPQIDYKETLLPLKEGKKFELLKDVSAMANADGGVIIFGVTQDDTGAPGELPGLDLENIDDLHNQIDHILNDNLDEPVPGLRHRAIPRPDGKHYYVIQVPQSYLAPHMITMPSTKPRFYQRVNTINVPMTTRQIKDASLLVERAQNRAMALVEQRIRWNARFPGPAYTFNIVPLYSKSYQLDLTNSEVVKSLSSLSSGYITHALQGLMIKHESQFRREHVLITRDGAVEKFHFPIARKSRSGANLLIPLEPLENELLDFVQTVARHEQPGLSELPALLHLKLVSVKSMGTWGADGEPMDQVLDEDEIMPDPVILHDWTEVDTVLKNFFDVIWQSFGAYGSPNYDENGTRRIAT